MIKIDGAGGNVPNQGTNVAGAAATSRNKEAAAAKKVAKEFEAMFIGMMLKSMRETVGKDKLTDGGHGEDIFRSMLDQEYAKAVTDCGGVGLAAIMERQLNIPAAGGTRTQGYNDYDTRTQSAKTEVNYENR